MCHLRNPRFVPVALTEYPLLAPRRRVSNGLWFYLIRGLGVNCHFHDVVVRRNHVDWTRSPDEGIDCVTRDRWDSRNRFRRARVSRFEEWSSHRLLEIVARN